MGRRCGTGLAGYGFGHVDKTASSERRRAPPGTDYGTRGGPSRGYRGAVTDVRRATERYPGGDPGAGIESWHAFSFGPHYDPDNLRFGALIACNEERLLPGAGFDEHPHSHTEIVTWVVEGELTHRDSTGHETLVRAGDVQRLSAAAGVRHVERNDAETPLTFVQTWLAPLEPGGEPSYEIVRGIADSTPYAIPAAGAMLHVRRLTAGERTAVPDARYVYVHVVRGEVQLDKQKLGPGDAARFTDAKDLDAVAVSRAELLVWEMP
jgi:redox-sensitive bicupin YhaK (pirin superfamily)